MDFRIGKAAAVVDLLDCLEPPTLNTASEDLGNAAGHFLARPSIDFSDHPSLALEDRGRARILALLLGDEL